MSRRLMLGALAAWAMLMAGCESDGEGPVVDSPDAAAPNGQDAGPQPDPAPDPDPDRPDAGEEGGWIELGTGTRTFEPLDPGQEVPIIQGIQGGFHVWGGFRGGGFDDGDVRLRFWLDLDGETLARADYAEFGLPTDRRDPTTYDYAGVAVVYDSNDAVQPTSGSTMTLRVEVESVGDGQVLEDMIEVVPVCCQ